MSRAIVASLAVLLAATTARGQLRLIEETFPYDAETPAAGVWLGRVVDGHGGPDGMVQVLFAAGEDGAWTATVTSLGIGALGSPAAAVEIDERAVAFESGIPGRMASFEGTIDETGQRLTGNVTLPGHEDHPHSFELARTPRPTDLPAPSAWKGAVGIGGMSVEMVFVIAETPGGNWVAHCDVPMQQLRGFPFVNVERTDDQLSMVLPSPAPAVIEVAVDDETGRMTGMLKQAGMEVPLDFARVPDYAGTELVRPQMPKPPFPYEVVEFAAPHPGGFAIAGTLTIPERATFGDGPFPTAVLISGSGQQDRDETLLGHKPFLVIADHLTRHGIAVARYDDRGVGGSTVEDMSLVMQATSKHFATDTAVVIEEISTHERVDTSRIGLVGHSEGGMIAPMVAAKTDIDFIVLLAGPGVSGGDLLREQIGLLYGAAGFSKESIEAMRPELDAVLTTLAANGSSDALRAALETLLRKQMELGFMPGVEDVGPALEQAALLYDNAWMRFFVAYDPVPALEALTCPVLAMNGTLDLQVWHEQNLDAIERVLTEADRNVTVKRYEGLNHLFQPAKTGSVTEYAGIETTIDPVVLEDLTAWISEVTGNAGNGKSSGGS